MRLHRQSKKKEAGRTKNITDFPPTGDSVQFLVVLKEKDSIITVVKLVIPSRIVVFANRFVLIILHIFIVFSFPSEISKTCFSTVLKPPAPWSVRIRQTEISIVAVVVMMTK